MLLTFFSIERKLTSLRKANYLVVTFKTVLRFW